MEEAHSKGAAAAELQTGIDDVESRMLASLSYVYKQLSTQTPRPVVP